MKNLVCDLRILAYELIQSNYIPLRERVEYNIEKSINNDISFSTAEDLASFIIAQDTTSNMYLSTNISPWVFCWFGYGI